jgi:hypothetical protein
MSHFFAGSADGVHIFDAKLTRASFGVVHRPKPSQSGARDPTNQFCRGTMTATRSTAGAISLSICSHLLPISDSKLVKPVMLPPGRARFSTKPPPTGSETRDELASPHRPPLHQGLNPSTLQRSFAASTAKIGRSCPRWVISGNTQSKRKMSALHPKTDIAFL